MKVFFIGASLSRLDRLAKQFTKSDGSWELRMTVVIWKEKKRWSRRPGLNGATCHRFGPETCLTDSYKGGQAPLYDPHEGGAPPSNPPQFARSMIWRGKDGADDPD